MSSARKRAAIQKANNEADHLRQRLMLAEHHGNVMQGFAEMAARKSDAMAEALKGIAALRTKYPRDPIATANEALQIADAALMGSNVEHNRRPQGVRVDGPVGRQFGEEHGRTTP